MKDYKKPAIYILIIGMSLIAFLLWNKNSSELQVSSIQTENAEHTPVTSRKEQNQKQVNKHIDKQADTATTPHQNNRFSDQNEQAQPVLKQDVSCVNLELETEKDPTLESDFIQFAADIGLHLIGTYNEYAYYDEQALQTMAQGGDKRAIYSLGLYYAWYPDYHTRMLDQYAQPRHQSLKDELSPVERLELAEHWLMKAAHEGMISSFAELVFVMRDKQIYQMNTPQDQALDPESIEKPVLPPYSEFVKWIAPESEDLGLSELTLFSSKTELSSEQKKLLEQMKSDWIKQRQSMGRDVQLKLPIPENLKQVLQRLMLAGDCKLQ
jgi:hypothetical protein